MGINIIRTCDKCSKILREKDQLWKVGVTAKETCSQVSQYDSISFVSNMNMLVCRSCLESFGIYVQKKTILVTEPPTLEELICDIVQTHIDNQRA